MKTTNLALSLVLLSACNVSVPSPSTEPVAKTAPIQAPITDPIPEVIQPTCLMHDYHCSAGVLETSGYVSDPSKNGVLAIACDDNPAPALSDYSVTVNLDFPIDDTDVGLANNVTKPYDTDLLVTYDSVVGKISTGPEIWCDTQCHWGTRYYVVVKSIDQGIDLLGMNDTACQ